MILAAGQGTRMASPGPKVLQSMCGRPMLGYVVDQALALEPNRILVVVGHGREAVEDYLASFNKGSLDVPIRTVHQAERKGTAHAVLMCAEELEEARQAGVEGPVVVLSGDMPLLRPETLGELTATFAEQTAGGASLLTAVLDQARGFGRILRDPSGARVVGIVEEKDASPEQRALREVNVGVYAFDLGRLLEGLPTLRADNAQGEYYLPDMVAWLVERGAPVLGIEVHDPDEAIGVNTLKHLSEARAEMQLRILERHMVAGVKIEDPATTYIDHDVDIGPRTTILPCTVIRAGVSIGSDCEVGPFTHLRVGTRLDDHAEVGNFTECKKSTVGSHTKAKHLTYLGDVTIGAGANIGAGTIVANYDGTHKHKTHIGDRAFIGSGSILIAPCTVGDGALTGAGAVVRKNSAVGADEAWVGVPAKPLTKKADSAD